jgi:hypothetical protein
MQWRRLEYKATGRLLVGFGHAMTVDAAPGITSNEHITTLPRGTAGMAAFTAYVAESRARGTTWTMSRTRRPSMRCAASGRWVT